MRKKIFTMLLSLLAVGLVHAQTVIFDPATFTGDLADGMEVVELDGTKYLQVVVNGWNSTLNVPEITTLLGTQMTGMVKYAQGSSTVDAGLTLDKINSVVQVMDTVNRVPPSWDPSSLVPSATSLIQSPTTEGWKQLKADITKEQKLVHQIQFFGQETVSWGPVVGDTIWVGRIITVDASILFDPASIDVSTLPEGMEIVEENGEKLLKVKVNGWNSNLSITPFEVGKNNKMTVRTKYEAGTSGVENANAQCFIQPTGDGGVSFNASINPAPAELTEIVTDAKSNTTVNNIQIAAQQTSGDWDPITDAFVYVSKITVSYAEAQMAVAPNTTVVAFSADANDIEINGLWDDAYGEVANAIARVATNETGGDISETNSSGEWLAVGDLENFYIFIEINDDDPIALGTSTSPWMNDGVELFMDIQNRRYVGGKRISGEQHQMRINYGTEGPAIGGFGMDAFFDNNDTTNIEFAVTSGSNGYIIEARIPWATWYRTSSNTPLEALEAINLKENMKIAFEVSLIDADALDGRKSILNWSNNTGEDKAYYTNEFYGEITLKGGWPVAIKNQVERALLNVYPNPANNQINVVMDNAASVEIYNVVGAKVLSSKLNGSTRVDVSELNQGVYIIKVIDVNGKSAVTKFNKK